MPYVPLIVNTLAFAIAFAAWVALGPVARPLAAELGLGPDMVSVIKALPILTGSVLRVPVGMAADRWGARRVFAALLAVGALGLVALALAGTAWVVVVGALVLGLVGTTFVVGVQSVSSWTPPERQGVALGVFGAGNVGTVLTALALPGLAGALGWRVALGVFAVVLLVSAVGTVVTLRDAPGSARRRRVGDLLAPLAAPRAWVHGLAYAASFGVYVAATLLVADLYVDNYDLGAAFAGLLSTAFLLTGGLSRIPGGWLADRFGAHLVLLVSLPGTALGFVPLLLAAPLTVVVPATFIAGVLAGFAMAATFKAIPGDFPGRVGAVGGIVGALGGVGGFVLPILGAWTAPGWGSSVGQLLPLVVLGLLATVVVGLTSGMTRREEAAGCCSESSAGP